MENLIKTDIQDHIIELRLNVLVFQEGDYFVSYCPSLNLSSYGTTVNEAKTGFDETMEAYLEDGKRNGTLQEDLIKNGWKFDFFIQNKAEPPAMIELNIPAGHLRKQF